MTNMPSHWKASAVNQEPKLASNHEIVVLHNRLCSHQVLHQNSLKHLIFFVLFEEIQILYQRSLPTNYKKIFFIEKKLFLMHFNYF